jgi:galactose mutarotase-like enzyme
MGMSADQTLSLQNDLLHVRILPAFGGKITSLRSALTGEEFLLPPLQDYRRVSPTANFDRSDGGGFDECLPSVASCESIAGEASVPDHGDLWRISWNVDSQDESVILHADAASRPLRLTRRAILQESSLVLDYELFNLSDSPTTWLWSAHPLLRVDAGDRIVLPSDIEEVKVEYSASDLVMRNRSIAWPRAQSRLGREVDLSKVGEKDGRTAHKLFARVRKSGWGALYREKVGQGLIVRFDPSTLPFLGLWICAGAWPATGAEKQYTVALEPTTSDVDSLESAERNGTSRSLGARERYQWKLEIQLIGASSCLSFDDFRAIVDSSSSNPAAN